MANIRNIIKALLFTPNENGWGLVASFYQGPGFAKSYVLREVAKSCGLLCEVLSPGERGEGAFGCVPVPRKLTDDEKSGVLGELLKEGVLTTDTVLDYPLPSWALPFFRAGRGVVVCDEVTTTPPALMPALLGLLLDKRIGGQQLPLAVRMLGAYNPPECAATGYDLPPPVANRMAHIKWEIGEAQDHADYISVSIATLGNLQAVSDQSTLADAAEIDPAAEEARVLREWPAAAADAAGAYAGFITKRPDLLHQQPEAHDPKSSGAWPSRRTWAYAVRALATCKVHGLTDEERDMLIYGYVGAGAGGEFIDYLAENDLPSALDVLDGKVEFVHDKTRLDITHAVLSACVAYTCPPDAVDRDARAKKFWKVLSDVVEAKAKDVAYPHILKMAKAGHLRHKECRVCLKACNKMMEAAGIKVPKV